ncbi:hypothetical protein [Candidatus Symbiopectobacterium sp.]|uniref:hypothetical protein n=1 Tax=Candidatus Symbiopectobacterium sp. TaxID=2816440 RepID=UPI0025BC88FC|nr:hypothetical protein [Candidatus Symbiopectobacterium sp.]
MVICSDDYPKVLFIQQSLLNPERGDASLSDQHFNPKQACHNSIISYYSTKPLLL